MHNVVEPSRLIPDNFHHPKQKPIHIDQPSPIPFIPWKPPIYFLYLWVCLFFTFRINEIMCMALFLNKMFSMFVYAVACISTSFILWLNNFHWMNVSHWFIHSSDDAHLGCFHFLVIMNYVAMNICVQVFVWIY